MNEKFFNYYVEILTSTLHDTLGKNLVFQAESRVDKEELQILRSKVEELSNENNSSSQNHDLLQSMIQSLNSRVEQLSREKTELQNSLNVKDNEQRIFNGQLNDKNNEISSLNKLVLEKEQELKNLLKNFEDLKSQLTKEEPVKNTNTKIEETSNKSKDPHNQEVNLQKNIKETLLPKFTKQIKTTIKEDKKVEKDLIDDF